MKNKCYHCGQELTDKSIYLNLSEYLTQPVFDASLDVKNYGPLCSECNKNLLDTAKTLSDTIEKE